MAVVQVRVNRADDGYQNARREDLIAILDGLGQNTRRLESEIAELEERKNSLSSSADKAQTAREQAEAQVRTLGILAGTLPAQGPGVRITTRRWRSRGPVGVGCRSCDGAEPRSVCSGAGVIPCS